MNASILTSATDSALPIQSLFKAGQFVRIKGSEAVGRVLEDTNARGDTKAHIFDDDIFGPSPSFGPGCLAMWTPDVANPVVTPVDIEHIATVVTPVDIEHIATVVTKLAEAFTLAVTIGAAVDAGAGSDVNIGDQLKLIGLTFGNMAYDLLDELHRAT